jgi:small nuclear ribonucleoprotein (snRNP)-like protein
MLVELKNGETLNGHLVLCDTWMNLTLREVVQTSPVGGTWVGGKLESVLADGAGAVGGRQVCEVTGGLRQRE